jgi:hypothetical protein
MREPDAGVTTGDDQVAPLSITTWKLLSTAAQHNGVGHETNVNLPELSMTVLADHLPPLQLSAPPLPSTATHKEVVGQEMEVSAFAP